MFVIGFDPGIVSEAILDEKRYSKEVKGRDYLEKIVQIEYRIPRATPTRGAELVAACLAEPGATGLFGDLERSLVLERNERNPRRIKRFLNGFVLAYGLSPEWRELLRGA